MAEGKAKAVVRYLLLPAVETPVRGIGVLGIIGGLFFGFNFFWSNFLIEIKPLAGLLPAAGIVLIHTLFALFFLFYLLFRRLITRDPQNPWAPSFRQLYTLVILPVFTFQLLLTAVTLSLLLADLIAPMVYLNDYLRYFMYAWILAGMTRLTVDIKKEIRYKYNLVLIGSFCLAFLGLSIILKQVRIEAAGFFR